MKTFLLNFAWVTLVALLCCASATVHAAPTDKEFLPWAKQAYAVLDEEGTLTFRYDSFMLHVLAPNKKYNIEDHYYDHGGSDCLLPAWPDNKVKRVVISSSFAEYRPTSTAYWFYKLRNLTSITGMENLSTSQVTDMNHMFRWCINLRSLDVLSFNTGEVTDMSDMFHGCSSLKSLDVSHFNTSKMSDMRGVFNDCSSFTNLDVSGFNTSQVIYMDELFMDCGNLKSLDLRNFNTQKVKYMGVMFNECSSLSKIYCKDSWSSTYSQDMFRNCIALKGAISYDASKTDVRYANPTTGYFTKSRKGDIDDNG